MPASPHAELTTRERFHALARECGFELSGVAAVPTAGVAIDDYPIYSQWVDDGLAGPLGYLTDHRRDLRSDPRRLLPTARSVLCLGKLYRTGPPPEPATGRVSSYAWGSGDYHHILRKSLRDLVLRLQGVWGPFDHRICVDTAPLLERSLARQAGLGWIGKNTCLINELQGSWFFLGEILVALDLPAGMPPPDRCGSCTRCIHVCPTQALVPNPHPGGPAYRLDARRCLSTLTIEQRGATTEALREGTGDHLFGCDLCQEVCPWNSRSSVTAEPAFQPQHPRLNLAQIAELTPETFRALFRRTPVWRAGLTGLQRNACTAMGNSGDARYLPVLQALAESSAPGVAEHARWALARLQESGPALGETVG